MSDLLIQPIEIQDIREHPNADRLEIATIGGWDIITGKGNYDVGDIVVHIPPDVMVPQEWSDEWEVTKYLSWRKNATEGRVRAASLRGVVSFGFLVPNESEAELGTDLADHYGITKYDPPQNLGAGQTSHEHPLFHRYTDIQNLRNYKDKLTYDQHLTVTEKIHGTNSRVGWVKNQNDEYEQVIGSHNTQRDNDNCGIYGLPMQQYQKAMTDIMEWLIVRRAIDEEAIHSIIFFGEIFGAGVQDLHYGAKSEKAYRLFDISVNGQYLPWGTITYLCTFFDIPTVPVLTSGIFAFEDLLEESEGNTLLNDEHIREGIVVRPTGPELTWGKGTRDPNPKRMIFKVISGKYLTRKGGTEMH